MKEIILVSYHIENWLIIVDIEGACNSDTNTCKDFHNHVIELINTLNLNYPFYLERFFFINSMSEFEEQIIDFKDKLASIYEKIIIIRKNDMNSLQKYIHVSQIEEKYGGKCPNFKIFWPPKNIINQNVYSFLKKRSERMNSRQQQKYKFMDSKGKAKSFQSSSLPFKSSRIPKSLKNSFRKSLNAHEYKIFERKTRKKFLIDDIDSITDNSFSEEKSSQCEYHFEENGSSPENGKGNEKLTENHSISSKVISIRDFLHEKYQEKGLFIKKNIY